MKVHKNTLKRIMRLIEDAMDSEKALTIEESCECIYQALAELDYLINFEWDRGTSTNEIILMPNVTRKTRYERQSFLFIFKPK